MPGTAFPERTEHEHPDWPYAIGTDAESVARDSRLRTERRIADVDEELRRDLHRARRDAAALHAVNDAITTGDEHMRQLRDELRGGGPPIHPTGRPEELVDLLIGRLRYLGCRTLADALERATNDGDGDLNTLPAPLRAELDGLLYGTGYVVNGERVDPRNVRVYRGPTTPDAL
jgi:hypothetical protein